MEFVACLRGRRSVRRFADTPIEKTLLERIVENAAYAPSWKNVQPTRYIAVVESALKQTIAETCLMEYKPNRAIIENAPMLVIATYVEKRSGFERDGSPSTSKLTHWESFDTGLAVEAFCLSAWNEGVGTVIMGIFDEASVCAKAGIPEGQRVAALIAVGYPAETPNRPKRKNVADILSYR